MNKIEKLKYVLLICLIVGINKGEAQEVSINHYKISNPELKSIIKSIIDYNSRKLKENKLFEYDYFWIVIKEMNNETILTISRVKKEVIDFEFNFEGQKGYFKFRDNKFMVSGFDNQLFKIKNDKLKYHVFNNKANKVTNSLNSEFDYWEYYLIDGKLNLKYAPDDFDDNGSN